MNYNCSIFGDLRNLQEQVKKAFCYQKLFWPFTVWINCSSDLKNFENSRLSASNFKSFSRSLEQFFLTVGQNNFGNKIPEMHMLEKMSSDGISIHVFLSLDFAFAFTLWYLKWRCALHLKSWWCCHHSFVSHHFFYKKSRKLIE